MGIRFHCPSGHKLNVKAFLAGKRAICPKCGAKVVVPLASESDEVLAADEAKPIEASAILSQAPASAIGTTAGHAAPSHAPAAVETAAATNGSPSAQSVDPINEAPSAVWYVRPPGAGQFGPAAGPIMRTWLAEGRIGPSYLVWRAGWPEWRAAAEVFPQLVAAATPPAIAAGNSASTASTVAVQPVVASASPAVDLKLDPDAVGSRRRRRKQSNNVTILASLALVVIAVVLIVVLIVVLKNQS